MKRFSGAMMTIDNFMCRVARTVVGAIGAGLAGRRVHDFFELAHTAGETFHKVGELASDLVTPEDEKR
jgi:hypothetical protein